MAENGKALWAFHLLLISCAVLYCFGFAFYQVRRFGPANGLGIAFAIAGVLLCVYLRSVVRYGLSGKPKG